MNRLLALSFALALLTGGAMAQAAAPTPPGTPPAPGRPDAMNPDAGVAPPPGGPPPPNGPRAHRPPPPSTAAHLRIERGDTAVDIKCADDEPMKACADVTLQLLDKLKAMPGQAMPGAEDAPKP